MTAATAPSASRATTPVRTALAVLATLVAVAIVLNCAGAAHASVAAERTTATYQSARSHHRPAAHERRSTHHRPATHRRAAVHRRTTAQNMAYSLLSLLNRERAQNHLPALTMNANLVNSAHGHNLAMARADNMSHQTAGEQSLGNRLTQAGYKWTWAGENIGWNGNMTQQGVLQLEQLMYSEQPPNDGHRLNILSTHFTNIGVDVYMDYTNQKVWLTTDFGRH